MCLNGSIALPRLGKPAIRCDEPLEHWNHQLFRFDWPPTCFAAKDLAIGNEIAMEGRGQFCGSFTGFSSGIGPSFSLVISTSKRCKDKVAGDDHEDREGD